MKFKIFLLVLIASATACSKPMMSARVSKNVKYFSDSFAADKTNTYAAARWALNSTGYIIASENQSDGVITSTWLPTKSDSHALELFDRREFGANGAYFQLEIRVSDESGRTRVEVGSRVDSIVANLKSTGIEERRVLNVIGNYLRTSEPNLSNIGIQE